MFEVNKAPVSKALPKIGDMLGQDVCVNVDSKHEWTAEVEMLRTSRGMRLRIYRQGLRRLHNRTALLTGAQRFVGIKGIHNRR